MKFLIDNQLPLALARNLDVAEDLEIWRFAFSEGRTVISKDEDFFHLAIQPNASGSLVWVRLGNCRKQLLLAAFDRALPELIAALQQGQKVVEIR